ncbi:MAG TPA: putative toxin-antitoxin system toxin component, PIN family [Bacteroidales bacterium]|nr:putative toxin-antitoxin system toxin component, PIN family [Bacteroidales bacterium]
MKKANKSFKIIIDTNIWISFLIGKNLNGLQNHIENQNIRIITCIEQLIELSEVFKKTKLRRFFKKDQIEEFFELLDESAECIEINTKTDLCRDPKDNYLISLAIDSKADFLITGDKDILELSKVGNTIIAKFTEFNDIVSK